MNFFFQIENKLQLRYIPLYFALCSDTEVIIVLILKRKNQLKLLCGPVLFIRISSFCFGSVSYLLKNFLVQLVENKYITYIKFTGIDGSYSMLTFENYYSISNEICFNEQIPRLFYIYSNSNVKNDDEYK